MYLLLTLNLSYEVKHEEKWFGFQTWNFQKPPKKLHFSVIKKDPGLPSHFHVLNLFKSWSN
jgi:hypothetical protein